MVWYGNNNNTNGDSSSSSSTTTTTNNNNDSNSNVHNMHSQAAAKTRVIWDVDAKDLLSLLLSLLSL